MRKLDECFINSTKHHKCEEIEKDVVKAKEGDKEAEKRIRHWNDFFITQWLQEKGFVKFP